MQIGGVVAAQQAVAVASSAAPPVAGTTFGSIAVTALAEVLALFVLEAKLRADLGALAGQPTLTPRELASTSSATCRRPAAGGGAGALAAPGPQRRHRPAGRRPPGHVIPARFARIVIPEIVAPLIDSAVAARLALGQVRTGGEQHWGRLRTTPSTVATWGPPGTPNGGRPPAGWPVRLGPPPGGEPASSAPPER